MRSGVALVPSPGILILAAHPGPKFVIDPVGLSVRGKEPRGSPMIGMLPCVF